MSTFGTLFRVTTYGESHCASVGAIIDGCPPVRQSRKNCNNSTNNLLTGIAPRGSGRPDSAEPQASWSEQPDHAGMLLVASTKTLAHVSTISVMRRTWCNFNPALSMASLLEPLSVFSSRTRTNAQGITLRYVSRRTKWTC